MPPPSSPAPRPELDYFDNWTVQVRKGLLELFILNALSAREYYGYDLVKSLVKLPGLGVTEGTVYPLLSRLRVQELVATRLEESPEGPARKYYRLTDKGRAVVTFMNDHIDTLMAASHHLRTQGGPQ